MKWPCCVPRVFNYTITKEEAHLLSGFVFPKFNSENAHEYLYTLKLLSGRVNELLYGMPILEGREIAYSEKRVQEMLLLRNILKPYKDIILNIVIKSNVPNGYINDINKLTSESFIKCICVFL